MITSMILCNFIRKYVDNDQEFQPFDNDDELLPTSESENQREENNEEQSSTYVKWIKNMIKLRHFSSSVNILVILLIIF